MKKAFLTLCALFMLALQPLTAKQPNDAWEKEFAELIKAFLNLPEETHITIEKVDYSQNTHPYQQDAQVIDTPQVRLIRINMEGFSLQDVIIHITQHENNSLITVLAEKQIHKKEKTRNNSKWLQSVVQKKYIFECDATCILGNMHMEWKDTILELIIPKSTPEEPTSMLTTEMRE